MEMSSRQRLLTLPGIPILLCCLVLSGEAGEPVSSPDFNQEIRPILSENCFFCHGPDENHREADLRLDDR